MTESALATNAMAGLTMAERRLVVETLGGQAMAVGAEAVEILDPRVDVEHAISRRPVMLCAEARPRCKVVGLLMACKAIASRCASRGQRRMHSLLEIASPGTSIPCSSPASPCANTTCSSPASPCASTTCFSPA